MAHSASFQRRRGPTTSSPKAKLVQVRNTHAVVCGVQVCVHLTALNTG